MKLFVDGRKNVFKSLSDNFSSEDRVIWLHAASLGEYEQGLPVLKALKKKFPEHKILVTFFSPSGYEVKKNNAIADCTTYLPLDTPKNAAQFINLVPIKLAVFVKYEVWPNFLQNISQQGIKTILISGNFRADQVYFKSYGRFMKEALHRFDHLFVQNNSSKILLERQGFENVSISGDTRFDRVSQQLKADNHLGFVDEFKDGKLCLVCGSTWPEDLSLLIGYFNDAPENIKIIVAPHQINSKLIADFRKKLDKGSVLYSEKEHRNLEDFPILIVDTVGLLTKIYAYADIAYVGGAAGKTGLHNILEPAAFGLPIVIGKNHEKFPEAALLQKEKGLFSVNDANACYAILNRLITEPDFRKEAGHNSDRFIKENRGATAHILAYLNEN